jgi:hypothetical protein
VLQKVVMVINVMFKKFMTWLVGEKMQVVMMDFKNWVGVPTSMIDVIDNIHIAITKPFCAFAKHYFSHKTWNYSIVTQIMVNNQKRFIDVYVGLPRSLNGSHVSMKFRLYCCPLDGIFFDMNVGSQDGLPPYLFRDKGHPLCYWLMASHKKDGKHH